MIRPSYIRFRITIYSPSIALSRLRQEKIPIRNFKKIDDYTYEFSCSPIYLNRILRLFDTAEIIKKYGALSIIQSLWFKKTTLVALVLASLFFYDISSRVHAITIVGINRSINARMHDELNNLGVVKFIRQPNYQKLVELEQQLKSIFHEEVEFLELRLKGAVIEVKYMARRDEVVIPEKKGALYAKKDGIIAYFLVFSGEKMVRENQFVREGDLLINDRIMTPSEEEIIIGAYGQVYAYTWTIVEVTRKNVSKEGSIDLFQELLNESKRLMSSGFYLDEKIVGENVLSYEFVGNNASLKMHFTCLEDIAN